MPACLLIIPIPAVAHPAVPAALAPHQCRSLLDHLADPRHRRGRRHALGAVLAVVVAAVRLARSDITAA